MLKERILTTLEEIKVISDPFRFKILILFSEENTPLTVKQISVKLNEVSSKVHYHVKELERIGVLEIVETREKGGVIEKFYLPTAEVFKVEKNIGTQDMAEYHRAGENIFNAIQQDFIESNKHKKAGKKYKEQFNYALIHLTDEEADELGSIIKEFLKDKDLREGTNSYMFGYTLFRKLGNKGEMESGS